MRFGILSGCLWGFDTVILSIALSFGAYIATPDAIAAAALLSSAFHDILCALWMFVYMALKRKLKDTWKALKTKNGLIVVLAAILGGPIGMCSYVLAIENLGPGLTAIISSFYPAFGTFFAALFLKEKISGKQVLFLFIAIGAIIAMGISAQTTLVSENATYGLIAALTCVVGWGSEAVLLSYAMRSSFLSNEISLQIREITSAIIFLCIVLPFFRVFEIAVKLTCTLNTAVIALAAFVGVASYLNYYRSISQVGASRAMATNISYSAWAVLFGLLFLGHVPTGIEIVCCFVILVATILAASDWNELFHRTK